MKRRRAVRNVFTFPVTNASRTATAANRPPLIAPNVLFSHVGNGLIGIGVLFLQIVPTS